MRLPGLLFLFLLLLSRSYSQQTKVSGTVTDALTGEALPFVRVSFQDAKVGTMTDSTGHYLLETYYATDSLLFFLGGYTQLVKFVIVDHEQVLNAQLKLQVEEMEEVTIRPPDELPSTRLHKRVIAHKDVNNKEKLDAYGYEVYNKLELDLNNIGDKFIQRGLVHKLDLVMHYLDSADDGKTFLPVVLSETISEIDFKKNPKKKKEIVSATRITGIENIQFNQFLGEMYLDFNIYHNSVILFNRAFISPIANSARSFYRFYLEDSTFIDNQWCYKLRFTPKRSGDLTFEGEMWIHDTTYAVKSFKANISPGANINYVQGLYMEQHFEQVEKEVWMLTEEKMIVDLKYSKDSKLYGLYGRKYSSRKKFEINPGYPDSYYDANTTVQLLEGATTRDTAYWAKHRHTPLNVTEKGISEMIDSLNTVPFFRFMRKVTYTAATGYYRLGKIEIGSLPSLVSFNPIEHFRSGLAIRTSNGFSRRVEYGGKLYYGFGDQRFKYGVTFRANLGRKKRALLSTYYNYDIEQIGISPTAAAVGSTFNSILRTGPLNKLTFVSKVGANLEKDVGKDIVLFGGLEWKEYTALGLANYERYNAAGLIEQVSKIQTAEVTARIRWAKNEEFISGAFDRTSVSSKYPILSLQGIFGVKGIFGSDYNYQKLEFSLQHSRNIGVLGYLNYGFTAGYIFGNAAYPLLKVHEGSQSYWLYSNSFNRMSYFEFVSDKYVTGLLEQHWQGLLFDRVPLIKKLKWRLVTTGKIAYGAISDRHQQEMILPAFIQRFGATPYVEAAAGIENIFKLGRVDLVWRATHLYPGIKPLGVRASVVFNF